MEKRGLVGGIVGAYKGHRLLKLKQQQLISMHDNKHC